jgi:hypothetical protein
MKRKMSDRVFIFLIVLILLAILMISLAIRTEIPKIYIDETISIVGKFIRVLVSFFKR